jgi:hypothetical protein
VTGAARFEAKKNSSVNLAAEQHVPKRPLPFKRGDAYAIFQFGILGTLARR